MFTNILNFNYNNISCCDSAIECIHQIIVDINIQINSTRIYSFQICHKSYKHEL